MRKAPQEVNFIVRNWKDLIPRQQFKIPVQASIGGKIIARETVNSFRKDVTANCTAVMWTRKNKLLDKQKRKKKNATIWKS